MSIPFDVWLDGILRTATFLANNNLLRRVWIEGDYSVTSITNISEAQEQLFDDLDAENQILLHSNKNTLTDIEKDTLKKFIDIFACFDEAVFMKDNGIIDHEQILNSNEWAKVSAAAETVVRTFLKTP